MGYCWNLRSGNLVSLAQEMLSAENLNLMFIDLPRRCIVLLEDIDSASLAKRQKGDKINA
jgi:hypothetical protein